MERGRSPPFHLLYLPIQIPNSLFPLRKEAERESAPEILVENNAPPLETAHRNEHKPSQRYLRSRIIPFHHRKEVEQERGLVNVLVGLHTVLQEIQQRMELPKYLRNISLFGLMGSLPRKSEAGRGRGVLKQASESRLEIGSEIALKIQRKTQRVGLLSSRKRHFLPGSLSLIHCRRETKPGVPRQRPRGYPCLSLPSTHLFRRKLTPVSVMLCFLKGTNTFFYLPLHTHQWLLLSQPLRLLLRRYLLRNQRVCLTVMLNRKFLSKLRIQSRRPWKTLIRPYHPRPNLRFLRIL